MGKSTLAKELIAQYSAAGSRVIVFDYVGEYQGRVFESRREIDLASPAPIVYRGSDDRFFSDTAWKLGALSKPVLVVLDEVDIFGKNSWPLAWLYRYGRHRSLSILAIARRFYDLPVYIRALTSEFKVFQITDERDMDYIRRVESPGAAATIRALRPHEYITIAF